MLRTLGSLLVIFLLVAGVSAGQQEKSVYRIYVDGLSCPFCTYGIEKKFSKVEGVENIEIDLKSGTTVITMAAGKTLDEATARKTVEAAGFTLRDFEQVPMLPAKKGQK